MQRADVGGHVLVIAGALMAAVGAAGEWATGVAFGDDDPARPAIRVWMFLAATVMLVASLAMVAVRRGRTIEVGTVVHLAIVVLFAVINTRSNIDDSTPPLDSSISWGLYGAAAGALLGAVGLLRSRHPAAAPGY